MRRLCFCVVWFLLLGSWSFAAEIVSPLSPADAQKAFVLADSALQIELAAAEPEIVDPVAIRFDEDGRMWVVEMRDYPLGNGGAGSRIRVLEDKDGDGRFESATTFAEKLQFVTGLQPWQGGVFVTLAGALVYMKDTSGDGRSDLEETWFEGFAEQNTQLRANHPRLGLDNWIYVANGLRGGTVVSRRLKDQKPINISGMDFRFDPRTGKAEAVSGNGQFGMAFDDWGNRFVCSNRNPVRHVVIEDRYLKANPDVTVPAVVNDVAAWGEQSRIFPISRAWTTSNLHAGQFTAACGVYLYRGDLLPAEFKGNAFTCDPTGNLVHREILQPAGPTFTGKSAYEGKEFLASPDEWFRPVNMELGPDGALYIVDMYRCVIEHPDFVPDELKKRPDQRLGDDRGRIWRIAPANTNPTRQRGSSLSTATSDELIALLEHPNAWRRETAQRLLLTRNDDTLAIKLRELSKGSKLPQGRAHALWLLAGRAELNDTTLEEVLRDQDPLVRAQAVALVEQRADRAVWEERLRGLATDSDPRVRYRVRLAFSLGGELRGLPMPDPNGPAMRPDFENPWQRAAIRLQLGPRHGAEFVLRWVQTATALDQNDVKMVAELCEQAAADKDARANASEAAWVSLAKARSADRVDGSLPLLTAVARGLGRGRASWADVLSADKVNEIRDSVIGAAQDERWPSGTRQEALELLGTLPGSSAAIVPFLEKTFSNQLRASAATALARQPGTEHWPALVSGLAADTPIVRRAIVDGLLTNPDRIKLLLDAIEAGQIKAFELEPPQVKRLVENRDAEVKARAAKLLASAIPADRAQALADYQPVLKMTGVAKRGQAIFEKNCSACHRIAGIGVNVAPDISDSRTKKLEQLLGDILQPNRAIDNNYLGYVVRQTDGTIATGILTAETATSITLKQQGGKEAVIARSEIDELRSSGQSLMPEGLERNIPPQDMADLLSFIKNWRYLDGRTPLSQ